MVGDYDIISTPSPVPPARVMTDGYNSSVVYHLLGNV